MGLFRRNNNNNNNNNNKPVIKQILDLAPRWIFDRLHQNLQNFWRRRYILGKNRWYSNK